MQNNTDTWDIRTKLLVGEDNYKVIQTKRFLIIGNHPSLSYTSEYLIRAGVINLTLYYPEMNNDISLSLHAFTVDQKNEQEQLLLINPEAKITLINKPYDSMLMKTYISSNDIILIGIENQKFAVEACKIGLEFQKKVFCVLGGYGLFDSTQIQIKNIERVKKSKLATEFKSALYKENIRRNVRCIYGEDGQGEGGLPYIFSVMGIYLASQGIDSIITRRPIQLRAEKPDQKENETKQKKQEK
ncbi:hypothetical protein ENUP19_0367G0017 [Entamoeba nuttalli]|uniref:Uncharacterized protein n=2 Tax=Entamoeba nuttalli TaxID=412467 RepID=K2H8N0_ENTNP|nr:hypothetical protein ENU1_148570 [Entamoeba nuttalli P19]EKE38894.1 hypothetical protein ENU1_148570 [Entamoeba nuttalli P19]|eukprot:XP_008858770.1 hypothetical protein ENU1_148570 [Entamoeba nuttalli P19]